MEQLLCHLVGDYWLQNDWMALNKKSNFKVALLHAVIYTLPFVLLTQKILPLLIICITHAIIDGTNIIGKLNQIKNWHFEKHKLILPDPTKGSKIWVFEDGYTLDRPVCIRVWLLIIQDNIVHLLINYLVLRFLG